MGAIKREEWDVEQVVEAAKKARGYVSHAARLLGCSRNTFYEYMAKYPEVAQALEDEREAGLDDAELSLRRQVLAGEGWAVCFTLRGKRGYVDRVEHSGANGGPMRVELDAGENLLRRLLPELTSTGQAGTIGDPDAFRPLRPQLSLAMVGEAGTD